MSQGGSLHIVTVKKINFHGHIVKFEQYHNSEISLIFLIFEFLILELSRSVAAIQKN